MSPKPKPPKSPKAKPVLFAADKTKEGPEQFTWKQMSTLFGIFCALLPGARTLYGLMDAVPQAESKLYDWKLVEKEIKAASWVELAKDSDREAYRIIGEEVGKTKAPNLALVVDILNGELEDFRQRQIARDMLPAGTGFTLIQDMGHLKAAVKLAQELAVTNDDGSMKGGRDQDGLTKALESQQATIMGIFKLLAGQRAAGELPPAHVHAHGVRVVREPEPDDILAVLMEDEPE